MALSALIVKFSDQAKTGPDRSAGVVRTGRWSRRLAARMAHDASSK